MYMSPPSEPCTDFQLSLCISTNSVGNINTAKWLQKNRKQIANTGSRYSCLGYTFIFIFICIFIIVSALLMNILVIVLPMRGKKVLVKAYYTPGKKGILDCKLHGTQSIFLTNNT